MRYEGDINTAQHSAFNLITRMQIEVRRDIRYIAHGNMTVFNDAHGIVSHITVACCTRYCLLLTVKPRSHRQENRQSFLSRKINLLQVIKGFCKIIKVSFSCKIVKVSCISFMQKVWQENCKNENAYRIQIELLKGIYVMANFFDKKVWRIETVVKLSCQTSSKLYGISSRFMEFPEISTTNHVT